MTELKPRLIIHQWDHFLDHVTRSGLEVMEDPSRDRNCHGHASVAVRPWFRVCSTPLGLHCSLTDRPDDVRVDRCSRRRQ